MIPLSKHQHAAMLAAFQKANDLNDLLQQAMDECDALMTEFNVPDHFRAGGVSDLARVVVFNESPENDEEEYIKAEEFFVKKQTAAEAFSEIVGEVDCSFGAPMGRPSVGDIPAEGVRIFNRAVPLDSQGYDHGGAYWGHGAPLRVAYTKDLSFVWFYRTDILYPDWLIRRCNPNR